LARQAERRAQTRAKLLKAAGAVFARRGYHAATLDEIAQRAGVSKGALYYNFASKEDLFLALLSDRLGEPMGDVDAFYSRVERDPRWAPLFFEFMAWSGREPRHRAELRRRFFRPARESTRASIASGTRTGTGAGEEDDDLTGEELAAAVNALVNGLLLERLFDPERVPADLVGRAVDRLLQGARSSARTARA
jgi:AcrR family transcriptional regulator